MRRLERRRLATLSMAAAFAGTLLVADGVPATLGSANPQSLTAAPPALYDTLGGRLGAAQIVDAWLVAASRHAALSERMHDDVRMHSLHETLVEHLCAVTGGPCVSPEGLEEHVLALRLLPEEAAAASEALLEALARLDLEPQIRYRVAASLAPLRPKATQGSKRAAS